MRSDNRSRAALARGFFMVLFAKLAVGLGSE